MDEDGMGWMVVIDRKKSEGGGRGDPRRYV